MTTPIDPNHFHLVDGVLTPQPWMQHRLVASSELPQIDRVYSPTGNAINVEIHSITMSWTNTAPIPQNVYGLVTRGGCRVTLQARSRAYLTLATYGFCADSQPTNVVGNEVSRLGCGLNVGHDGLFSMNTFGITEVRQPSVTLPLTYQWPFVDVGDTFYASAVLSFVSDYWEENSISGGVSGTDSSISTGATRLDLFAVPSI